MDGSVLVALVCVVMIGVLGALALVVGGRIRLESRTADSTKKLDVERGETGQR